MDLMIISNLEKIKENQATCKNASSITLICRIQLNGMKRVPL